MNKIISTIAAALLTTGLGIAAPASAAPAQAGALGAPIAKQSLAKSGAVEAGFRVHVTFGEPRPYYGYHNQYRRPTLVRRCFFAGYRYRFIHDYGWIKRPVRRCVYRRVY